MDTIVNATVCKCHFQSLVISHLVKMKIENTQECFVRLWLRLEHTRRHLEGQYKRYCVRNVLKSWFGLRATDDFIWEVCRKASIKDMPIYGYDELPPPWIFPRKHRELLRAIVQVTLCISSCRVTLRALDQAYAIAFPGRTPLNVNKKARHT